MKIARTLVFLAVPAVCLWHAARGFDECVADPRPRTVTLAELDGRARGWVEVTDAAIQLAHEPLVERRRDGEVARLHFAVVAAVASARGPVRLVLATDRPERLAYVSALHALRGVRTMKELAPTMGDSPYRPTPDALARDEAKATAELARVRAALSTPQPFTGMLRREDDLLILEEDAAPSAARACAYLGVAVAWILLPVPFVVILVRRPCERSSSSSVSSPSLSSRGPAAPRADSSTTPPATSPSRRTASRT